MRSSIQPSTLRTSAAVLALLLLFSLAGCGIHPQGDDSSGRTAVMINLSLAQDQARPLASEQSAGIARLEVLIHITGPGLTDPIKYLIHDLQLGTSITLWVPTGSSRTFEVWIYQIPATAPAPDTFPATLLVTVTPPALRTVDLIGDEVSVTIQVAPAPDLASVGTYNNNGYLEIIGGSSPQLIPGSCGIVTQVTFIDPAFDNLALGPVPVHVGLAPNYLDGEYLITGVPLGRYFQLLVQQTWAGWSGKSEKVLISNDANPNPINVLLQGYQALGLSPANDYVADGLPLRTVSFQVTGGSGTYNFFSDLAMMGLASISPYGLYSVTGTVYADTVDTVTVTDDCFEGDSATAEVFWYLAPVLMPSESPAISPTSGSELGGDYVYLYGMGFDATTQVFFGGILAPTINFYDYYSMDAITPPHSPGVVDVRVFNPRSNSLLPDFAGFDFTMSNGFQYYAGGPANKFEAPFVGDPSRYQYTP
ncbi:MAG: hypothetical protein A2V67_16740 [Deltaproteobacteria bacterium RBG_13_61_14]|nr:MAG: hypothetical protein A2V67_16740 [Deltaproteobacteria bacterium RBG_13_61_14]